MKKSILFCLALAATAASLMTLAAPVKSRLASAETDFSPAISPLPEGVVAVEYIENTGASEFIQTGVFPQNGDIFRGSVGRNASPSNWQHWLFGAMLISQGSFGVRQSPASRSPFFFNPPSPTFTLGTVGSEVLPFQIASGDSYYNGVSSKTTFTIPDSSSFINPIMLFGLDYYNTGRPQFSPPHIKFGAFSIEREGELIISLIAVRCEVDGQWEGAMYDLVSGELFRNAGTGSFIIGPDL